jgi:hypothetical protein
MNTISTRSGVMQDSAFVVNLDGQNVTNTASNSGLGNRSSATKHRMLPPRGSDRLQIGRNSEGK